MTFEEYRRLDGLGLAKLVADRQVTAAELADVALARAASVNDRLGAITIPMDAIARERAAAALSGPFAGVPFVIKDMEQDYRGVQITRGCKAIKAANVVAPHHGEITERWLRAGVVVVGVSNVPEFAAKAVTEPDAWMPARNPWNTEHTPGGSSGGSAASVACGIVPMAGANDGGGSIRIPASHCGLFGFKPGRGTTPWGPPLVEAIHGAAVNHVLTRSVRDSAAMLDATFGAGGAGAIQPARPERSFLSCVTQPPGRLRIGFSTRSPLGAAIDPEAARAVEDAATLLGALGHDVERAEPVIDGEAMIGDFLTVWFGQVAANVARTRAQFGAADAGFEPDTLAMARFGRVTGAGDYVQALDRWSAYARALAEFHRTHDLLMLPTVAMPPARIGANRTPASQHVMMRVMDRLGLAALIAQLASTRRLLAASLTPVPFTALANMAGVPAMSVPLHWTSAGLPLGVQFVGPSASEGRLFALAGQLEAARPWFDRVPAM